MQYMLKEYYPFLLSFLFFFNQWQKQQINQQAKSNLIQIKKQTKKAKPLLFSSVKKKKASKKKPLKQRDMSATIRDNGGRGPMKA